jgi:predicted acyl esterase
VTRWWRLRGLSLVCLQKLIPQGGAASVAVPVAESPARDRPSVSEGFAQNIAHGILRGRYRNSLLKPELMEVGVVYETRVDLGPVAAKLGAGQKLRVEMSGADFPAL